VRDKEMAIEELLKRRQKIMHLENTEDERLASTKGTTNYSQSNTTAGEMFKMSGVTVNQSVR
jgi:hypothetical protein